MTLDLTHPAEQLTIMVAGVRDDQLDGPTPCEGRTVRVLLAHVAGLAQAFTDAAAKVVGPTTTTPAGCERARAAGRLADRDPRAADGFGGRLAGPGGLGG